MVLTPKSPNISSRRHFIVPDAPFHVAVKGAAERVLPMWSLKVLHESQAGDEESRARLRLEATVAARIHSDNVVRILEHGEWQGLPYIAMEYLEGEDLASRLGRLGKLDVYSTLELVLQLARALDRPHARGVVHRDIKPANVLLTSENGDEVAKLIDFDVAKEEALSSGGGLTQVWSTPRPAHP